MRCDVGGLEVTGVLTLWLGVSVSPGLQGHQLHQYDRTKLGEIKHHHGQHSPTLIHHTNAPLHYQVMAVKALVVTMVVLMVPGVSSLIWRLPGPARTNPIMDITNRLLHMGQTMARLMGGWSPYHHQYQHYQHHNTGIR